MCAADVLILGGGIAGLSTAWHLARLGGLRVVLLEREPAVGSQSSGQNAAILRTFGSDPVLSELARRGAAFLRHPPDGFAPVPLLETCGLLLLASGERARALRIAGADGRPGGHEVSAREVHRLAPHIADAGELRLYFPGDGRIDVAALIDGFARGAKGAGVELRTRTAARRLLVEAGRVVGVELEQGAVLRAGVTVLAAGGWAGRLGAGAGSRVELRPTRRHLLVTAVDPSVRPGWPVVWIEDAEFYCRPESGGMLLCACDVVDVDPDRCFPDPDVRARIAEKAARALSSRCTDARAAHYWCGLRTLTADDRFAIGPDPDLAGLFWVAGLGGHGMGSGPEVGRLAAALLAGESGEDPLLHALDPGRLAPSTRVPADDPEARRQALSTGR